MSIIQLTPSGGSVTLAEQDTASNVTVTVPARTANVMLDGPAFSAYQSSAQTISTTAKIQFQTEEFDTSNCFDSTTNYRFTPNVAGYYQIVGSIQGGSSSAYLQPFIYKNGSLNKSGSLNTNTSPFQTVQITAVLYLNGTTDYVEIFCSQSASQALTSGAGNGTYFQGFMVRGA